MRQQTALKKSDYRRCCFAKLFHHLVKILSSYTHMILQSSSSIGFCGSRSIQSTASPLISMVAHSVLSSSDARLAVGCSTGVDRYVIEAIPKSALSRVSIFAAFGPDGAGSCNLSAVSTVVRAVGGGASVRWWSGGSALVPIRQRLALRSVALAQHLAASSPSTLICFLSSPESGGSILACRRAAQLGVPVMVICIGFLPAQLPRLRKRGSWIQAQIGGFPAVVWREPKDQPHPQLQIDFEYSPYFS